MDASFWAHAAVSAVLILLTLWALRAFGVVKEQKIGQWSWPTFVAVLVVMFVLNLVWPWPT